MKILGIVNEVNGDLTAERAGSIVPLQVGDKVVEGDVLRSVGRARITIDGSPTQIPTWVDLNDGKAVLSYDHQVGRAIVTKGPGCTTGVDAYVAQETSAVIVTSEEPGYEQIVEGGKEDDSNGLGLLLFGGLLGGAALLSALDNDSNSSTVVPPRRVDNNPVDDIVDPITGGGGSGVVVIPPNDNGNNGNGQGNGNGNNDNGQGNGGGNGNGNNGNGQGNGGGNGTGNEGNGNGPGVVPVVDKVGDELDKTPLKDVFKPLIGDASDDVGLIGIIKAIGKGCDDSLDPTPLKPVGDLVSDILGAGGKNNNGKDIDGLIGLVDEISDGVDRGLDNTPLEPIGSLVNTVVGSKETGDKEGFLCDTLLTIDNQLVSIGSKTPLNPVFDLCDNLLTGR